MMPQTDSLDKVNCQFRLGKLSVYPIQTSTNCYPKQETLTSKYAEIGMKVMLR